jgi:hypothetical protein
MEKILRESPRRYPPKVTVTEIAESKSNVVQTITKIGQLKMYIFLYYMNVRILPTRNTFWKEENVA